MKLPKLHKYRIVEFEGDDELVATKILIKFGFIFPKKIEIDLNTNKSVEKESADYIISVDPIKEKGNFKGEYNLSIYKKSDLNKPYKTRKIFTDSYYVKYLKTPLGLL